MKASSCPCIDLGSSTCCLDGMFRIYDTERPVESEPRADGFDLLLLWSLHFMTAMSRPTELNVYVTPVAGGIYNNLGNISTRAILQH